MHQAFLAKLKSIEEKNIQTQNLQKEEIKKLIAEVKHNNKNTDTK